MSAIKLELSPVPRMGECLPTFPIVQNGLSLDKVPAAFRNRQSAGHSDGCGGASGGELVCRSRRWSRHLCRSNSPPHSFPKLLPWTVIVKPGPPAFVLSGESSVMLGTTPGCGDAFLGERSDLHDLLQVAKPSRHQSSQCQVVVTFLLRSCYLGIATVNRSSP